MTKTARILFVLAAAQALILALYIAIDRGRGRGAAEVELLARPAPDLVLRSAGGSSSRLSDLRGSVVVLHFWATWCPPCREELPRLLRFASSGTVEVVAASVDPEWEPVLSFVGQDAGPHVYLTSADAAADDFGVIELPQTFVIDPDGILRMRFRGPRDWNSKALHRMISAAAEP